VFSIPRKPLNFVLIDPAAVNHVLKANFDNYIKVRLRLVSPSLCVCVCVCVCVGVSRAPPLHSLGP
jgi:hypothetical protein